MTPPLPSRAVAAAAALLLANGCAALNQQVDHWALEMKAQMVLGQKLTWTPGVDLPYRSSEELERLTRPRGLPEVSFTTLEPRHRLDDPTLVQEELRFTSAIPLRFPEAAVAKARVYRHGALGERTVLLWVPGQNVSERDFASFGAYFDQALQRDVDVVFFVPPYHLDRTPQGYGSGDAFLATDFIDHLHAFAQELSDLRSLTAWLRSRGVKDLGAFGGSMGGTMVLRLIGWEPLFDFVTAMQPVVDWNALIRRPEMEPVRARLRVQGVSDEDVMLAYHAIDPRTAGAPRISPQRISLLYGRYDLIAGEGPLLSLKRQWGVGRVRVYDRGHAFISFGGRPVRDVGASLEADLRALRWRRYILELIEKPTW
ncbi:MAG TPA: prolyl oligopeptidase family serine peptidase [Myxococcales bacterium]|jgi:hypothetical protein